MMIVKILKWGNSLALRIPKAFAREIKIEENSDVNLTLVDGALNIEPVNVQHEYQLEELIDQVNENNLHSEYDTGEPKGKEIW